MSQFTTTLRLWHLFLPHRPASIILTITQAIRAHHPLNATVIWTTVYLANHTIRLPRPTTTTSMQRQAHPGHGDGGKPPSITPRTITTCPRKIFLIYHYDRSVTRLEGIAPSTSSRGKLYASHLSRAKTSFTKL